MVSDANAQLSSSPDPLNASPTYSTPAKRPNRTRHSLPLQGGSPRKQTFELDVGNQLSPQKIRVTVEAGNSIVENTRRMANDTLTQSKYYAPTTRPKERTRTTTIPVKGLSDSEDESPGERIGTPKRGRGRPRKSAGTPIPGSSKRLSSTPAKKNPRRRTLGDLVGGDDSDDLDFVIGAGVEIGRGKGRSRSRSLKSLSQNKDTHFAKPKSSLEKLESSTTINKGRAKRPAMPEEVQVLEDVEDRLPAADKENFTINVEGSVLSPIDVNAVRLPQTIPFQSASIEKEDFRFQRNTDFLRISSDHGTPLQPATLNPCVAQPHSSPSRKSVSNSTEENVQSPDFMRHETDSHEHASVWGNLEHPSASEDDLYDGLEEEARDDIGTLQEFDTILESEGFSMISVDSVPSLRQHFSSPLEDKRLEAIQSSAVNKSVLSVQKASSNEDSFSSIAPEIFEAATPGRKMLNSSFLSIKRTQPGGFNGSFLGIPPEILKEVTPKSYLVKNKFLAVKESKHGDGDDSFSSIPPAVLEAATPAKQKAATPELENQSLVDGYSIAAGSTLLIPAETSSEYISRREHSSRLLTPDETPSPGNGNLAQQSVKGFQAGRPTKTILEQVSYESSLNTSQIQSSPPVLALQWNSHDYPQLSAKAETPSLIFSSPSLPPLKQHQIPILRPEPRLATKVSNGPSISPIVRAGRALQDIVVPGISSTQSSLRSPFKSPVGDRQINVNNELNGSRNLTGTVISSASQNGNPIQMGNIFTGFNSGTRLDSRTNLLVGEVRALDRARSSQAGIWRSTLYDQDPFTANESKADKPQSREDKQGFTFGLPKVVNVVPSQDIRKTNSNDEDLYHQDDRSWSATNRTPQMIALNSNNCSETESVQRGSSARQPEVRKCREVAETAETRNERLEKQWAQERAAVSREIESASTSQVIVIESDDSFSRHALRETNDDGQNEVDYGVDIWQAEARQLSSFAAESSENMPDEAPVKKPRRRKIPSPLTIKESKIPTYQDPLLQTSLQMSSIKDVSETGHGVQNAHVSKSINPNPGSLQPAAVAAARIDDMSELSVMWHIPQKSNFKPRPVYHRKTNKLDLSALFNSSPTKPPTSSQGASAFSSASEHLLSLPGAERATTEMLRDPKADVVSASLSLDTLSCKSIAMTSSEKQESRAGSGHIIKEYSSESDSGESSVVDGSVHAPTQQTLQPGTPTDSNTPRKSCLRTPSAISPNKTVIFAVENPPSLPPSPVLSSSTWSKDHWKLLDSIYQDSKTPAIPKQADENSESDNGSAELPDDMKQALCSQYLGKTITSTGTSMKLEVWHLQIVALFREAVWGWDEGVIAKRLFAVIVGEEQRRQRAKRVDS